MGAGRWRGHRVKRIVGRRHILDPAKLVDIEGRGFGRYRATDIRPFVLLESNQGALPAGWVQMTYRLDAGTRVCTPSLFAHRGDGTTAIDQTGSASGRENVCKKV